MSYAAWMGEGCVLLDSCVQYLGPIDHLFQSLDLTFMDSQIILQYVTDSGSEQAKYSTSPANLFGGQHYSSGQLCTQYV